MTRKISRRSYNKPDSFYSPIDLVVCEGETEVDYLCEVARILRIHAHICKGDGTDPKSIVNTAIRKSKEDGVKYDKIFCVFDKDNNHSAYLEAIDVCKSKNFVPIVSNPCFELWAYLHFRLRDSGFGSPQEVLKALKKLPNFERYDKDGVLMFNLTHHLLDTACKNATILVSKQQNNPLEDPYTNVHLLISRFQLLKNEQNHFNTLQNKKRNVPDSSYTRLFAAAHF